MGYLNVSLFVTFTGFSGDFSALTAFLWLILEGAISSCHLTKCSILIGQWISHVTHKNICNGVYTALRNSKETSHKCDQDQWSLLVANTHQCKCSQAALRNTFQVLHTAPTSFAKNFLYRFFWTPILIGALWSIPISVEKDWNVCMCVKSPFCIRNLQTPS